MISGKEGTPNYLIVDFLSIFVGVFQLVLIDLFLLGDVPQENGDPFCFLERLQNDLDHDRQRRGKEQADRSENPAPGKK